MAKKGTKLKTERETPPTGERQTTRNKSAGPRSEGETANWVKKELKAQLRIRRKENCEQEAAVPGEEATQERVLKWEQM